MAGNGVAIRWQHSRTGGPTCDRHIDALGIKLHIWSNVEGIPLPAHNASACRARGKPVGDRDRHGLLILRLTIKQVCNFEPAGPVIVGEIDSTVSDVCRPEIPRQVDTLPRHQGGLV